MADYYQVKNQNIFNPPANTSLGNATNQFNTMYVENDLVLGNVTVTGATIIAPRITTITYPGDDTAADTAGGQTITLTGTGFVAGANLLINGSAVGVVSVVSSTTITFTSPANTTGSYVIYVINPDGSTAIAIPGIQYSGTPNWTTAAGTLGNVYETDSFTQTVTATGDAPITYSVTSGSIPPGSTFNANGTITGTSQLTASPTTYSFTVRATDAEAQDTDRAFSISVIPDVVTWSNPTANATYSPAANVAIANITLSATSAVGSGITYSANTLPTGLSLTGANISGTPTVVANTSSLLTATANTTSESSSITINWSVSVASDPYFMYNSLLLPGTGTNGAQNNTFLDGSTNNFTVTRVGNTTQGTFSPYGPNWSNYFDGTGDYLSVADNASLEVGSGDFTLEGWFYATAAGGTDNLIVAKCSPSYAPYWVSFYGGNSIKFCASSTNSGWDVANNVSFGAPTLNTWNHFAVSRSGTSIRLFLNGVLGATVTSSAALTDHTSPLTVGSQFSGANPFTGYISNVRLVKGTAVYTAAFTPSTTPLTAISGTSLLTSQSNRFIDTSSNAFTITVNGNTNIQRFSPFSPTAAYSAATIGGSGYFDGSGDRLTLPFNQTPLLLGNSDFTFECWVYCNNTNTASIYTGQSDLNTASGSSFVFYVSSSSTSDLYIGGTGFSIASPNPQVGAWAHVAWCRTGGTYSSYLNGVRIGTLSNLGANSVNNGSATHLGGFGGFATNSAMLNGYIAGARFIKGSGGYTATDSTITIPTSPPTAITNTQLLTNFTDAGIIDNTMINNLETIGNAQISTAQTKFGGGSMYFDGTGDYLFAPTNIAFAFGTGNFTIEAWCYFNNATSTGVISNIFYNNISWGSGSIQFGKHSGASPAGAVAFWAYNLSSTVPILVDPTLPPAFTWVHYAVVRNGNAYTLYRNGTSVSTATNAANIVSIPTSVAVGGSSAGSYFDGYIDDLRITTGYARYTSNFTPPTSAFPTY